MQEALIDGVSKYLDSRHVSRGGKFDSDPRHEGVLPGHGNFSLEISYAYCFKYIF